MTRVRTSWRRGSHARIHCTSPCRAGRPGMRRIPAPTPATLPALLQLSEPACTAFFFPPRAMQRKRLWDWAALLLTGSRVAPPHDSPCVRGARPRARVSVVPSGTPVASVTAPRCANARHPAPRAHPGGIHPGAGGKRGTSRTSPRACVVSQALCSGVRGMGLRSCGSRSGPHPHGVPLAQLARKACYGPWRTPDSSSPFASPLSGGLAKGCLYCELSYVPM